MKKYLLALTSVFCILICSTSCRMNVLKGEGKKGSMTAAVPSFNAIDIDISLKAVVNVQDGAAVDVTLSGYENLLKHIKTTVENNTLRIYSDLDQTWNMESEDVTIQITVPTVKELKLTGASEASVHGIVKGGVFNLDISGASGVLIDNIRVDSLNVEVSGAGGLDVNGGVVKHAQYEINGAGHIKAFPLQTDETIASISGAGTGQVTALQKLSVDISGAGTIKYKGHPVLVQDVSGAGSITDAN